MRPKAADARLALARLAPPLAVLVLLGPAFGGCVKVGDSLGQSCLSDEDCFSGHCIEQTCVSAPPLLDGEAQGSGDDASSDGSPGLDAPTESSALDAPLVDSADAGATDAAADAHDASSDAGAADAAGEGGFDGSTGEAGGSDAAQDAPDDVRLDVTAGG
jgi:hypothetical protein